jgi:hypothetical protein
MLKTIAQNKKLFAVDADGISGQARSLVEGCPLRTGGMGKAVFCVAAPIVIGACSLVETAPTVGALSKHTGSYGFFAVHLKKYCSTRESIWQGL